MSGTLYGVGVGPGDPELMTVKAWRLISSAKVIAYLAANGGESTARGIAAPFIDPDSEEIAIDIPMRVEREPAQAGYDAGSAQIAEQLAKGTDVVFLCEGDPFFYGSFIYIFARLSGTYPIVVVPGVTSLTAAAAELRQPLAERDGIIKVLPATLEEADLRRELQNSQAAAIIKVGRHLPKVKSVLTSLDLMAHATAIEYATQPRQRIRKLEEIADDSLPYFSLIQVNRKP
jgi:precorrin-2/cobalt-factor-2 C20-methyltransferase